MQASNQDEATTDFAELVAVHWTSMVGLAVRLSGPADGEDVAQEALAAAWRLRDRFDPQRGTPRGWLLALTADHARRLARRRRVRPEQQLRDHDVTSVDPGGDLDLRRAVGELSERQQLAVALYYYLDLPVEEVATVMRCSAGTVKSTLSDARRRLRTTLAEEDRP